MRMLSEEVSVDYAFLRSSASNRDFCRFPVSGPDNCVYLDV